MRKRLEAELKRLRATDDPFLWCTDDDFATISCVDFPGVLITPGQNYPFSSPHVRLPVGLTEMTPWIWLVTLSRRASNRRFIPTHEQCLCCASPLCEWSVQKCIRDVLMYAACVVDASLAAKTAAPNGFLRLPTDVIYTIASYV